MKLPDDMLTAVYNVVQTRITDNDNTLSYEDLQDEDARTALEKESQLLQSFIDEYLEF